jgi:hypothetical protein
VSGVLEKITGKGEYILRGKTEEGGWVEISKYDREVKWAEIREEFEEDLCDKYERIMLYDKKKRRPLWVRNCKPPVTRITSMTQALSTAVTTMVNTTTALLTTVIQTQNTMVQMMNQMMAQIQSNRPSLADELAHAYQMIKVARLLAQEAGGGKGGVDELDRIFMLIDRLRGLRAQPQSQLTSQPQPQTQSRELPPELKAKLEEIDREVQKTYEEIEQDLDEAFAVCREVEGEACESEIT